MADFYVLPPRPAVGEQIARAIRPFLPGLSVSPSACVHFLERLVEDSGRAFLVHPEDLPDESDIVSALHDGFGANETDRVIQIGLTGRAADEPRVQMLRVAA